MKYHIMLSLTHECYGERYFQFTTNDVEHLLSELENDRTITIRDDERGAMYIMVDRIVSLTAEPVEQS